MTHEFNGRGQPMTLPSYKRRMADSEQAVRISNKLFQTRAAAKMMLGSRYGEFTHGMAELIREIIAKSPRKNLSPLVVATEMAGAPGVGPSEAIAVLATAVDMVEGLIP